MELPEFLSVAQIKTILDEKISLSEDDLKKVNDNRFYLDLKIKGGGTYYGINTGFGSLCNVQIADEEIQLLQENLVCSHACGFGEEVPKEIVKIMLLLKIRGLAQGYSGIHEDTLERLIFFYNNDILPVVYQQGSLGASGDLAPLAHLSLPLLGKGEVNWSNKKFPSSEVLKHYDLEPITLHAKEGLALLNGTQFMSAYSVWCLIQAEALQTQSIAIAAISLEAFDGRSEPFSALIQAVRPHPGQIEVAKVMRNLLKASELQTREKTQVQDPYSFRCIPQVHGASKDAIQQIQKVVEIEINSVTDNPIVFEYEDQIISGGNFHGQPLALNLDFMAIALAELASISERRTYLLISGQRGLPPFLARNPGLNSGFMIAQYTAASIVSQNKQLCTPASVDSIVSSNGQEDHVSMGANAATKLKQVVDNVRRVLAIELLVGVQALEFRRPQRTSPRLEELIQAFRQEVAPMDYDRVIHDDMVLAEKFLKDF